MVRIMGVPEERISTTFITKMNRAKFSQLPSLEKTWKT